MWRRERGETHELLRIGAHALERWAGLAGRLSMVGRCPLIEPRRGLPQNLEPALRELFPKLPAHAVTVLIESVHSPVVHMEVGPALWSVAQVEPLLMHRLSQYDDRRSDASPWSGRLDYRPGDPCGLGYGLREHVRSALVMATEAVGVHCNALLPAFAWGLERYRSAHHVPNGTGWWVWPEQDRLLLARIEQKQVVSLNVGIPFADAPGKIQQLVEAERFRSGRGGPVDAIGAATWTTESVPSSVQELVTWVPIPGRLVQRGRTANSLFRQRSSIS